MKSAPSEREVEYGKARRETARTGVLAVLLVSLGFIHSLLPDASEFLSDLEDTLQTVGG